MPVPSTISAVGYFVPTDADGVAAEATLRMSTAMAGTLSWGGIDWSITGDPVAKTLRSRTSGSEVALKIVSRNLLKGTLDGKPLALTRVVLRPIPAAERTQSEAGPTGTLQRIMAGTPDYATAVGDDSTFWYAFGPVLYRGRLDGSARVLGIASDPGPSECLPFARRALIGDSGQKTQGFLSKLGLTRSYVLVNGFAVALRPSRKTAGLRVLTTHAEIRAARHALYNALLAGNALQAIVAFGEVAHRAYDLWAASDADVARVPVFKLAHPAAVDRSGSGDDAALQAWQRAVKALRTVVTPDPDGNADGPNFGAYWTELDYARIPRWDLPAVAPMYVGDDSWGRAATPRHNNCCERPSPDDRVSLVLTPPPGQGQFLRYRYAQGRLSAATDKDGQPVVVDASGLPTES